MNSGVAKAMKSFSRSAKAATAVEFALILPLFLALTLAILQLGLYVLAQQNLQSGSGQGARLLMTGRGGSMTQAQFLTAICPSLQTLFDCSKISVDIQSFSSFTSANSSLANPPTGSFSFNVGKSGDIVVVRLMYDWPMIGGLDAVIAPTTNGKSQITGTTVVRVEPNS